MLKRNINLLPLICTLTRTELVTLALQDDALPMEPYQSGLETHNSFLARYKLAPHVSLSLEFSRKSKYI